MPKMHLLYICCTIIHNFEIMIIILWISQFSLQVITKYILGKYIQIVYIGKYCKKYILLWKLFAKLDEIAN